MNEKNNQLFKKQVNEMRSNITKMATAYDVLNADLQTASRTIVSSKNVAQCSSMCSSDTCVLHGRIFFDLKPVFGQISLKYVLELKKDRKKTLITFEMIKTNMFFL